MPVAICGVARRRGVRPIGIARKAEREKLVTMMLEKEQ